MNITTGFKTDREGSYIVKDPQSKLDYSIDWSQWLSTEDVIVNSVFTISTIANDPAPITNQGTFTSNEIASVILSGGTIGNIYTITNTITTSNGLIDERFFRIVVRDKTA
jgi:hypothetical protein